MKYNFDEIIERHGTDSIKYDFAKRLGKPEDVLPLWVADMDFRAPQPVLDALEARVHHGIFGYSESGAAYLEAVQSWYARRFGWDIQPGWIVKAPGVVYALSTAVRAFTNPGDAVLIQQPVYYPFAEVVRDNERVPVINELCYADGRYTVDFEDFEEKIIRHQVRMFILCSPHNPVGRVWTREELTRMGDLCVRHGVIVVSDEIHADFVFPGTKHTVFAAIKPEFADITVTCTAPSKTFNLAALEISNIIISNPSLKQDFVKAIKRSGISQMGIMGLIACESAYNNGDEWLDALLVYLAENLAFVRDFLQKRLPMLGLVEPEGSYLLWIDCHALGLTDDQLDSLLTQKAKLWVSMGRVFGAGGEGFIRINIACPKALLERAFSQLEQAIHTME